MARLHLTFHHANQALASAYETEFHKADVPLTVQQFSVLDAVWGSDGPSQTDLVEATGIDRSTMADIVRRLVHKRFVTRHRDRNDRRKYILALTPIGKETTLRAQVIANRIEASIALQVPTAVKGIEGKLKAVIASVGSRPALVAAE